MVSHPPFTYMFCSRKFEFSSSVQGAGWEAQTQGAGWEAQKQSAGWEAQTQSAGWEAQTQNGELETQTPSSTEREWDEGEGSGPGKVTSVSTRE